MTPPKKNIFLTDIHKFNSSLFFFSRYEVDSVHEKLGPYQHVLVYQEVQVYKIRIILLYFCRSNKKSLWVGFLGVTLYSFVYLKKFLGRLTVFQDKVFQSINQYWLTLKWKSLLKRKRCPLHCRGGHVIWLLCLVPQNLMLKFYIVFWYVWNKVHGKRYMNKANEWRYETKE